MSREYTLQDEAALVDQLNHLLNSLALPLSLISPTDLTPRLLIAILESLLGARLPISSSDPNEDARTARVQSMKIFLGVLETDILQRDAGLSNVDPRRLADGADAEVFYVAEVLCAIGRDRDRELARARSVPLPRTPSPSPSRSISPVDIPRPPLSPKSQLDLEAESLFQTRTTRQTHPSLFSPSPSLLFPHDDNNNDSTSTSLFSDHHEDEYGRASDDGGYSDDNSDTGVSDILGALPPLPSTPPPAPHPLSLQRDTDDDADESVLFSAVNNPPIPREQAFSAYHYDPTDAFAYDTTTTARRAPVRYDGFIAPVDEAQELASFELSRSRSQYRSQSQSQSESVKAQYTRTLQLLNERARLLTQLSELRRGTAYERGLSYGHEHG